MKKLEEIRKAIQETEKAGIGTSADRIPPAQYLNHVKFLLNRQVVYELRHLRKRNPDQPRLFATYQEADAYPGTASRRFYEVKPVEREVVFFLKRDGWDDQEYYVSVFRTLRGAEKAKEYFTRDGYEYVIEVWEIEE